jgi:hypothetical protein
MIHEVLVASALSWSPQAVSNVVPEAGDFRVQEIRRSKGEDNWPFIAEKGLLMCAPSLNQRLVYFVPVNADGEDEYPINIDANLMSMAIVNIGRGDAFRPYDDFEQLAKRLSPYVTMGKRLCDQPAGTVLPESSL